MTRNDIELALTTVGFLTGDRSDSRAWSLARKEGDRSYLAPARRALHMPCIEVMPWYPRST
jgi:hypothetical protein